MIVMGLYYRGWVTKLLSSSEEKNFNVPWPQTTWQLPTTCAVIGCSGDGSLDVGLEPLLDKLLERINTASGRVAVKELNEIKVTFNKETILLTIDPCSFGKLNLSSFAATQQDLIRCSSSWGTWSCLRAMRDKCSCATWRRCPCATSTRGIKASHA